MSGLGELVAVIKCGDVEMWECIEWENWWYRAGKAFFYGGHLFDEWGKWSLIAIGEGLKAFLACSLVFYSFFFLGYGKKAENQIIIIDWHFLLQDAFLPLSSDGFDGRDHGFDWFRVLLTPSHLRLKFGESGDHLTVILNFLLINSHGFSLLRYLHLDEIYGEISKLQHITKLSLIWVKLFESPQIKLPFRFFVCVMGVWRFQSKPY